MLFYYVVLWRIKTFSVSFLLNSTCASLSNSFSWYSFNKNCSGICIYNHIFVSSPCDDHDMEDKHLLDHHVCFNYRAPGIPILEFSTLQVCRWRVCSSIVCLDSCDHYVFLELWLPEEETRTTLICSDTWHEVS